MAATKTTGSTRRDEALAAFETEGCSAPRPWGYGRRPRLPRRFGPLDVIHATNPAAIPPARRGQALVVTVHDLAFERFPELFSPRWLRFYRRGLTIAAREADLILTPSAFTAG